MVTINDMFDSLKEYIEKNIANKLELQKELSDTTDIDLSERVQPYVECVHLPHKNFTPKGYQVPYILIGLDTGNKKATDGTTLNIILNLATYGGDVYKDEFDNETSIPDATGYKDLLNEIDLITNELINNPIINGMGVVDPDIDFGIYDTEFTWCYWFGYVSFSIRMIGADYTENRKEAIEYEL